jgi:SAM-dependent methyltransferase
MSEVDLAGPNADQAAYWNEAAGPTWVKLQALLDEELRGLGAKAMAALGPKPGERIIDVGCGCGDTTLELARRVGPTGHVLGVDISAPMLAVARERADTAGASHVAFAEADAQLHSFAPVDGAFSRFGVMFFQDPVAAFANIRRVLTPTGRLVFVCWRTMAENPVMTVPFAAVLPLLPAPPVPPPPDAPGPFAFADRDRLDGILKAAGFSDIAIEPNDQPLGWGSLDDAVTVALNIGPLGAALRENPQLREPFEGKVREAFAGLAGPEGLFLDSATWIVTAR